MTKPSMPMLLLALMLAGPASAQSAPALNVELNALQPTEAGCRITFVASNQLGTDLDRAAFEIALFGAEGGIERLVALDFKAMPEGKTRVLQFELAELACDNVSRVLINDVVGCEGEGLSPASCLGGMTATSRLDVEFGT